MKLLRIEGVNLAYTVFDTEDLSTRRGGSLMLLYAIQDIEKIFATRLSAISTGASTGLFIVKDEPGQETLAAEVHAWLKTHSPYSHGTFVVDVTQGDFRPASEQAVAANRWRQMQSLSFSGVGLTAQAGKPCEIDDLRPAYPGDPKESANSLSVQGRRHHGIEQRQRLYANLLGKGKRSYTDDFKALANNMNLALVPTPNLEGKMAVFYADGNSFGAVGRGCQTPGELKAWDGFIKDRRKELLQAVITHTSQDPRWQTATGELRLETLLWGGDELMFVVPGWCGMALADLFFQQTAGKMRYPQSNGNILTHACGLVFCHHKAPISAISKLAKALADKSKELAKKSKEMNPDFKEKDSLNWVVLESFDQAGSQLDQFLATRYRKKLNNWDQLTLTPAAVHHLAHDLAGLKDSLPRSTMVRALRLIVDGTAFDADKKESKELMRQLQRSYDSVAEALSKTEQGQASFCQLWSQLHPGGTAWGGAQGTEIKPDPKDLPAWVKLLELWDYCQQPPKCPDTTDVAPNQTKEPA